MQEEKSIKISLETYELLKKIKKEDGKNIKFVVDTAVKEYQKRGGMKRISFKEMSRLKRKAFEMGYELKSSDGSTWGIRKYYTDDVIVFPRLEEVRVWLEKGKENDNEK